MIVVDTNVWSEALRPEPDARVTRWLARHGAELALTAITVGELFHGAARLPPGRRRDALTAAIEALVTAAGPRVLPYDEEAARRYAVLRAQRSASGRPVGAEDMMIAAICAAGGHSVATRNVADFEGVDLEVVDPWGDG